MSVLAPSEQTVYVTRDGPLTDSVSVLYSTQNLSAVPAFDFVPILDGLMVFNVGERQKAINLTILDRNQPVPDLVFFVILYNAQGMSYQYFKICYNFTDFLFRL